MWSHPSRSSIPHRSVANGVSPTVETRVASLTDSCLVQQFRAAADRDSMVRDEWLQRFETAMHSLPDRQRLYSTLPRLQHYRQPEKPLRAEPLGSTECFHSAVAGGENRP